MWFTIILQCQDSQDNTQSNDKILPYFGIGIFIMIIPLWILFYGNFNSFKLFIAYHQWQYPMTSSNENHIKIKEKIHNHKSPDQTGVYTWKLTGLTSWMSRYQWGLVNHISYCAAGKWVSMISIEMNSVWKIVMEWCLNNSLSIWRKFLRTIPYNINFII